jgi:hypothetical protein
LESSYFYLSKFYNFIYILHYLVCGGAAAAADDDDGNDDEFIDLCEKSGNNENGYETFINWLCRRGGAEAPYCRCSWIWLWMGALLFVVVVVVVAVLLSVLCAIFVPNCNITQFSLFVSIIHGFAGLAVND